jgi:hypothetical protein
MKASNVCHWIVSMIGLARASIGGLVGEEAETRNDSWLTLWRSIYDSLRTLRC